MSKLLLITPPFLQPNAPYPATAYLKGYLSRKGVEVSQYDLSTELLGEVFSAEFLSEVFAQYKSQGDTELDRTFTLRSAYLSTIDTVMEFLRGEHPTLADLICSPEFLPQGARFQNTGDLESVFGSLGVQDCAQYLCTLYLQDISDFIRAVVTEHFEIVKYAESLTLSVPEFSVLDKQLDLPLNLIEQRMVDLLEKRLTTEKPSHVGFAVPFPGSLLSALRCAQFIRHIAPETKTILGGGYPTTELRNMTDKGIFRYFDYVILDDGELALERILNGGQLVNTYTAESFHASPERISHAERGCPDFEGLPHDKYFSLCEVTNPMHRLWSNGRWNKMMLAHGCYWAKCAFCDTSLDYIKRYDGVSASTLVDWMEEVARQTGSLGFHFVDEAAPPKLLKELSLELLRRNLHFSWWTNIRFEKAYTGDLCRLMAAAGCIAVSGGLEVASDRLLKMIRKGITIETATLAMRNFYYAGIMVHAYLMYGLPTQTLQESVDALEIVRQMFNAELIDSAFWHRYAMTCHSSLGIDPEAYGVKRREKQPHPFANNEIPFVEHRDYNMDLVGEALRNSLANYLVRNGLERPAHKWFEYKAPKTTIEPSEITDHLIKPDASRIFDATARLVWIGAMPRKTEDGLVVDSPSRQKRLKFTPAETDFLLRIMEQCRDLNRVTTLQHVQEIYVQYNPESFLIMYHSKKWDILREFGLLQL